MEPTRMQQPVNPLVIAEALRRLNSAPSQNTAAMKVEDTRLRNLNQVENLQRNPVIASNPGSAIAGGVAQGIARMLARQRGEKNLDAAYAEYQQAEQMKAAQAAEAAAEADRVKRQRELQDSAWAQGLELQKEARANAEWERRQGITHTNNVARDAAKPVSPEDTGPDVKGEGDLRKEFSGLSKDFAKQHSAMGRILASAEDPSGAGDLALIFNYMKVLDPGSTVREGEFATAQNSGGVDDKVYGLYNQIRAGERLSPDQRADFVSRADRLYQMAADEQKERRTNYTGLAGEYGYDPRRVVPDRKFHEYQAPSGLEVGSEEGGYRYLGGDPADPNSWEQISG